MTIDDWRRHIDALDRAISALVDERFRAVEAIGALKLAQHLPIVDEAREAEVYARVASTARRPNDVREVYALIVQLSRRLQLEQSFNGDLT